MSNNLVLKINDDVKISDWIEFLVDNNKNNIFQAPETYLFFKKVKNYKPFVFAIYDNRNIIGLISGVTVSNGMGIKKYLSRRSIIWGGPIISYNKNYIPEEILNLLLNKLDEYCEREAVYTEFRNFYDLRELKSIFNKRDYIFEEHLNYIIDLKDKAKAISGIKYEKRRQIRKSIENGTTFRVSKEETDLLKFYEILKDNYSKKVKKPLSQYYFFEKLIKEEFVKLIVTEWQNKIIGGCILLIYGDYAYDWYRTGLDSEYKKFYPSTLAVWAGLNYCFDNGISYFDFMGAGKSTENYGVREFKSQFGGELVNYGRFIKINKSFLFKIGNLGLKIINKFN